MKCTVCKTCDVVQGSTQRGINRAQLVGTESGDSLVPIYDWQGFFDGWFKPFKGIKSAQHFRFSAEEPGVVIVQKKLGQPEERILLAYNPESVCQRLSGLPQVIRPPGLSEERKAYLRKHIRPFVKDSKQDVLCP